MSPPRYVSCCRNGYYTEAYLRGTSVENGESTTCGLQITICSLSPWNLPCSYKMGGGGGPRDGRALTFRG